MTGMIPFATFYITGGSTAQLLTSGTAAKLTFASAVAGPSTASRGGDPAVKADPTNSRLILNDPGIYEVDVELYGTVDGAMNITLDLYKAINATLTRITGARSKSYYGATNSYEGHLTAIIEVVASDLGPLSTVKTFDDPSASAGAGKPGGGFAGAGAAPQTGVYLEVWATSDATQSLTPTEARFTAKRIG